LPIEENIMQPIGKKTWLIPDMYWPAESTQGSYVSHEAICVLNTSDEDCDVDITFYYEDREPSGGFRIACGARRTTHIRIDRLTDRDGRFLPRGVGYAAVIDCSVPVVVQYTRVDTTQPSLALASAMAYPVE
jgi:hypothetical protein